MIRAMTSVEPPAEKGTINVICRCGQFAVSAWTGEISRLRTKKAKRVRNQMRILKDPSEFFSNVIDLNGCVTLASIATNRLVKRIDEAFACTFAEHVGSRFRDATYPRASVVSNECATRKTLLR